MFKLELKCYRRDGAPLDEASTGGSLIRYVIFDKNGVMDCYNCNLHTIECDHLPDWCGWPNKENNV